jgi:hypothetical protein
MSKETTVNRATPAKSTATPHTGPGSEKTGSAEQAARRAEDHQGALRNAPTNCTSNGADKKARPWRTG